MTILPKMHKLFSMKEWPDTSAERIIAKFGGLTAVARATNLSVSTIQGWRRSGHIPGKQQQHVYDCALELGLCIVPGDFALIVRHDKVRINTS